MTEPRKHKPLKKSAAQKRKTQTTSSNAPLDAVVESLDSDHAHLNVPELHPTKIAWPLSQLPHTVKIGDKLNLTLSRPAPQTLVSKEKKQAQTLADLRKLLEELVN